MTPGPLTVEVRLTRQQLVAALRQAEALVAQLRAALGTSTEDAADMCPTCGGTDFEEVTTIGDDEPPERWCRRCGAQLREETEGD